MTAHRAFYNFRWTDPGLQDLSGDSAFFKDESGQIFHTYSTYGRGAEQFLGIYGILDVMPKGRNETGPYNRLGDWARPGICTVKAETWSPMAATTLPLVAVRRQVLSDRRDSRLNDVPLVPNYG
jgi:hypothetical protein